MRWNENRCRTHLDRPGFPSRSYPGLVLLVWSADRFVEGSAFTARHFGVPPLVIGMVIVSFGTSAPEMMVSALAALQKNPRIALGKAYGSKWGSAI